MAWYVNKEGDIREYVTTPKGILLDDGYEIAEADIYKNGDCFATITATFKFSELIKQTDGDVRAAKELHSEWVTGRKRCPHGHYPEDCNACNVASDLAYDSEREDRS